MPNEQPRARRAHSATGQHHQAEENEKSDGKENARPERGYDPDHEEFHEKTEVDKFYVSFSY